MNAQAFPREVAIGRKTGSVRRKSVYLIRRSDSAIEH